MHFLRLLAFAAFLLGLPQSAWADEAMSCLNKEQRQAVIANGQVIPLETAMAALSGRRGEVVRARLCQTPKGHVYLLTLLARDGKVTRVTVDAKNVLVLSGS